MDRKSAPAMLVVLALLCCTSCDVRRAGNRFDDELIESLADLPGARQTTHDPLRAEIARITSEGGTPKLLMQGELPPTENVASCQRSTQSIRHRRCHLRRRPACRRSIHER